MLNWGEGMELGDGDQGSECILQKGSFSETGGPEIKCWDLLRPTGFASGTVCQLQRRGILPA